MPLVRSVVAVFVLSLASSVFATGNIELTGTFTCTEGGWCSASADITEAFLEDVTVTYSVSYVELPAEDIASSFVIKQNAKHTVPLGIEAPTAPKYYGGFEGLLTLTYVVPDTKVEVTRTARLTVSQQPPMWEINDVTVAEPDVPTLETARLFLHRPSTLPLHAVIYAADVTTTSGADYQLVTHDVTFQPGQTETTIGFNILPDEVSEDRERFWVYANAMFLGTVVIDDSPIVATLSPDDVVVMEGDPFSLFLTLSETLWWHPMVDLVSSNPEVAHTVLDDNMRVGDLTGYSIAMAARSPGDVTFKVIFPPSIGIEPPVANIHVFGGGVNAPETVTLKRGESQLVPLVFSPAPPVPVDVMAESSSRRVLVQSDARIPVSGSADLLVTGVEAGEATIDLYTIYGRHLQSIAVTVTPSFTVTAITPASGPAAGNTDATITGTGFVAPCSVKFGQEAAAVAAVTPTSLRVTTPAHAAGKADLFVTCSGETVAVPTAFTFTSRGRVRAVRH